MGFWHKLGSRRRFIVIGALVAFGIVVLAMRYFGARSDDSGQHTAQPVPVTAAAAARQDVPDIVAAIGTVQSIDVVSIQPRVTGTITKVEFAPGQDVKEGQELFLIDPRPFQAALDQAKAQLAHDQAVLEEAQLDLTRFQTLAEQKSIALQQAQDQAFVVDQDKGTVNLDQANVETARLNLEFCHITAPISGRAGALLVDLGNLVGPSSGSAASSSGAAGTTTAAASASGSSLVSIAQIAPIYVSFTVPQTLLSLVRTNQAAGALEVDAYSQAGKLLDKGRLTLIDNAVNTATGTVMMQATFTNADAALWPGEFVRVQMIAAMRKNVVTVPAPAVMAGPDGPYVYVIGPDDAVKRVSVAVTARQGAIAVIGNGLSGDEKVVTDGQYRLDNGSKVVIRQTTTPAPQSSGDEAQAD
jgi:multidrug efflux system membrane fusion protein